MRSDRVALTLVLLLGAPPGPARPEASVIERILAVVQERPVLLSEVRVVAEVRGLAEAEALEALIDERLMFDQAARLPPTDVSEAEVDALLVPIRESRPALEGRLSEGELRRLFRRQAVILKFVDLRFRPQVRVADDLPADEREREVKKGLDQRVEAWVKDLRAGAEIRYPR